MILLSLALAAECEQTTSAATLEQQVSAAEASFAAMHRDAFESSRIEAEHSLECLGEVLLPRQAASYHRMMALDAYLHGDEPSTRAAYHAALSLQPAWILPTAYAPEGHPLREAYESASQLAPSPVKPALPLEGGELRVDGGALAGIPSNRPAIVQVLSTDGGVTWSAWHQPGEELPDLAALPAEPLPGDPLTGGALPRDPLPRDPLPDPHAPRWLVASAVGAGASAALLFTYAGVQASTFDDLDTPYEELETLQRRANGGTLAATGATALALGLGSAALVLEF